ncbi:MAG: hypothetical protein VX278_10165 [Myxococcota bacterium]|nr:hypothetical protein [Myxococcota bacterium]
MLLVAFNFAFSAPGYLGFNGKSYIGLGPNSYPNQQELAVVDPQTGALWVERTHDTESAPRWTGKEWTFPEERSANYTFVDSKLVLVKEKDRTYRYFYDSKGRLKEFYSNYNMRTQVRYDSSDRVVAIEGPGSQSCRISWKRGIEVERYGFPKIRLQYDFGSNGYSLEVKDETGRVVRSVVEDGKLQYWLDPSGQSTRLRWSDNSLRIQTDRGTVWQMGFDEEERLQSLTYPDSSSWVWKRDSQGKMTSQIDPMGREIKIGRASGGGIRSMSNVVDSILYSRDSKGDVVSVSDALGVRVKISRDERSRITALEDATGGKFSFQYSSSGRVQTIVERSGARWSFEYDSNNQLIRMITPNQRVWSIKRDFLGWPVELESEKTRLQFKRDHRAMVSLIRDSKGIAMQFLRDAHLNLSEIRYRGGMREKIVRNSLGEISLLERPNEDLIIERSSDGYISAIGGHQFKRDINGRVTQVQEANRPPIFFARDVLGRISNIKRGLYSLKIQYNPTDLPIVWSESEKATSKVERNTRGEIVASDSVRVSRDPKGWISQAEFENETWKWSRDISGRVLRSQSPMGTKIGFERLAHGELRYIRYPDNSMLRFLKGDSSLETRLVDATSEIKDNIVYSWDQQGLLQQMKSGNSNIFFRRDPQSDLIAVEQNDSLLWSKTLDGLRDGLDGAVIFDLENRLIGLQASKGSYPYGQEASYFSFHRDKFMRISEFISTSTEARMGYDTLDRLRSICFRKEGCWKFYYDPRGVLSAYSEPKGEKNRLVWRPDLEDGEFSAAVLLKSSADRWIQTPFGLSVAENEMSTRRYIHDQRGRIRWQDTNRLVKLYEGLGWSYIGIQGRVYGSSNLLHVFEGGPIFSGDVAYDPFSKQRIDGRMNTFSLYQRSQHRLFSLDLYEQRSFWRDPLQVLSQTRSLPSLGEEVLRHSCQSPVGWLPDYYACSDTIGISGLDFMLPSQNRLVESYLRSILQGDSDPTMADIMRVVFQEELPVFPEYIQGLERVLWWNSNTKVDPSIANSLILE